MGDLKILLCVTGPRSFPIHLRDGNLTKWCNFVKMNSQSCKERQRERRNSIIRPQTAPPMKRNLRNLRRRRLKRSFPISHSGRPRESSFFSFRFSIIAKEIGSFPTRREEKRGGDTAAAVISFWNAHCIVAVANEKKGRTSLALNYFSKMFGILPSSSSAHLVIFRNAFFSQIDN